MVLIDPEYLNDRKVYVNILAAFRYGREDLDVLGLTFRKDLLVSTVQVGFRFFSLLCFTLSSPPPLSPISRVVLSSFRHHPIVGNHFNCQ